MKNAKELIRDKMGITFAKVETKQKCYFSFRLAWY